MIEGLNVVKKSIDLDEVQKIIMDNRSQGISDNETFHLLQERYYDKKHFRKFLKEPQLMKKQHNTKISIFYCWHYMF